MDKYDKALAVVCLVGAEDAVKASEFKYFVNSDAFYFFGRGDQGGIGKQRKLQAEESQGSSTWFLKTNTRSVYTPSHLLASAQTCT